MLLTSLKLKNFRSYLDREFNFSHQVNLIVGPNTSGKSNILESVYFLSTGKSERADLEQELINYNQEFSRVTGLVEKDGEKEKLEIILTRGMVAGSKESKKRYLINDVPKRMVDFVGKAACVLFNPEDLEIIIDSPSIRRRYLNNCLETIDSQYRRAALSYEKGLRQRNKLLQQIRDEGKSRNVLFFWDKLLIENGSLLTQKRQEFIDFVNKEPQRFGSLTLSYQKSLISPQRLEKYCREEVAAATTLVGPHRDDFSVFFRERNLQTYGSRGEQRTAIFSLKLGEMEYMSLKIGERPILLLDDIFSELDHDNRQKLIEVIPQQQTIMSTTDLRLIEPALRQRMNIISLTP